jgi:NhaP-type Na+/H+ or K+/H+ antiporter
MSHDGELDLTEALLGAAGQFMMYFFVSLLIGAVAGLMISMVFKYLDLHTIPWIEIGLFLLASYFPFVLCERIGCSGILAILIEAIVMRNYAFFSMSPWGQVTVEYGVEMVGNISENFIFAYVGISVPIMISNVKFSLVLIGCVALVVSRAISVFIVAFFVNKCRKRNKIPFSHQVVMTYGGLRGAVAFYLALEIHSEYSSLIITTTISLIVFSVVGLGATTTPLLILLSKWYPEDNIFLTDTPLAGEGDEEKIDNDNLSMGVITRIEQWDLNYAQKYL